MGYGGVTNIYIIIIQWPWWHYLNVAILGIWRGPRWHKQRSHGALFMCQESDDLVVIAADCHWYGTIPYLQYTKPHSSEVWGHWCSETFTCIFYEDRHPTLIIFLQPEKNCARNNIEDHKNMEKYFQNQVEILPQLKLSHLENALYPAQFWTSYLGLILPLYPLPKQLKAWQCQRTKILNDTDNVAQQMIDAWFSHTQFKLLWHSRNIHHTISKR